MPMLRRPMPRRARWIAVLPVIALLVLGRAAVAGPAVLASIAPVHSLAAAVMQGVGVPRLLVPAGYSPHAWALRPSDARAIQSADLVVWVGPGLEDFVARALGNLVPADRVLTLRDIDGLELLPLRRGADGSADEGDEGDDGEHGHDHDHDHEGDGIDTHLWLDPRNAARVADRIAEVLAMRDPAHADVYRTNAAALRERLAALEVRIAARLAPHAGSRFIVFHDAYQYFERRFGLAAPGVMSVSAEVSPGADRIRRLRDRVRAGGVACVFIEPQFPAAVARTLIDGTAARVGRLDPLGAGLEPGPDLYPALLEAMAESFADCLGPSPAPAATPTARSPSS